MQTSTWRKLDYITKDETNELTSAGAIGDVVADFFDDQGHTVHTDFSNRLIGITIDDLKNISNVVVTAVRKKKAQGVKVLLENDVINTLIIDQAVAERII
ncbi:sugar-binding domain-containing protein [Lactiplantibacillus daowaiensis]|uniref:Sugar-binding domain-containing protein n=1 Tax=Lactiplantibacillus daowaiensis TaxID=2559918 RepID=A0ABW1S0V8_9LACO|nr:sugar-binding domain-containing protein [Lactiplantibacillus daowaiensis]